MSGKFDLAKYLGTWYELGHYPSWYQPNDTYNTTAEYSLNYDGSVVVHNSTFINGQSFDSYGTAVQVGEKSYRVEFSPPEVNSLLASGKFLTYVQGIPGDTPNYVIEQCWIDETGGYYYAIVSDPEKKNLYLLSRSPHPPRTDYDMLISYITSNYDRKLWVATPHYD